MILLTVSSVAAEGLVVGSKAPNFLGRTLDGKVFRLNKSEGKLKVVNFWWVFCKPCVVEMPELIELEKKYTDVKFIFVHVYAKDNDKIPGFLKNLGITPSTVVLGNSKLLTLYKFQALPHTVVLDSNNKILLVLSGYTEENMKKIIEVVEKHT